MNIFQKKDNTELELRGLLQADDPKALDWIWDHWADELLVYLRSLVWDMHRAEDLLQELFLLIVRRRDRLAEAKKIRAYLFRMARNLAMDASRKLGRELPTEDLEAIAVPESDKGIEEDEELRVALSKLPEKQRTVISMKHHEGKTFSEVASILRISENTVASRYRYGLKKLKQWMGGSKDESRR
jgi:RNA polymerase sigma-70 factor (ECF subfamily)